MSSLDDYFHEELLRLRYEGAELAQQRPDLAPFLGLPAQDPDIERLLEGVAFLCAQIRGRLDDEFPELSQALLELTAPQLLAPLPAMGLLHCQPPRGAIMTPQPLSAGSEFLTVPHPDGAQTTMRTLRDGWIFPAELISSHFTSTSITIMLELFQSASLSLLPWSKLTFWLSGDPAHGAELFALLHNHLAALTLQTDSGEVVWPTTALALADLSTLTPLCGCGFDGGSLELLDDWLHFPASLLFFHLNPPVDSRSIQLQRLQIRLIFDTQIPETLKLYKKPFQINLFPCANLHRAHAEPIVVDGSKSRYPLLWASLTHIPEWIVHLRQVVSEVNGHHQVLSPLGTAATTGHTGNYLLRQEQHCGQQIRYSLQLSSEPEHVAGHTPDILSVEMDVCSTTWAERVTADSEFIPGQGSLSCLRARLATPLTRTLPPSLAPHSYWQWLGQMSSHLHQPLNREGLCQLLSSRHRLARVDEAAQRKLTQQLTALLAVEQHREYHWHTGQPYPRIHTRVTLDRAAFGGAAECLLFGYVLSAVLTRRSPVNTLHRLTLTDHHTGGELSWPATLSTC